jgi:ankyrin repeat protein
MEAVEFLLQNGADPNTKNSKNFTLLMYCVKYGNLKLVKMVIRYGAYINSKDLLGFTALDYAVEKNNLEMVKYLVDIGAHITDEAYMMALQNGYKKIVAFFDCLDPNKEVFIKKERYCTNV